jgi:predicted AAA+ superfamily ATPase
LENIIDYSNKQNNISKRTFDKLINSLSRNLSTPIKNSTIANDIGISNEYISKYIEYAQNINLYEPLFC